MEPKDVAEAIERQKKQKEDALAELSTAFSDLPGWRPMHSGSFGSDIAGNARVVVSASLKAGFTFTVRVGSKVVASRTLASPAEPPEYVDQVRGELNSSG